ncbi:DUF2442 domain-containing protein [uncultured Thiodictyon sp.]|uniref:DUF2442 domain-containing protein n=1 Tax=uncultured Thiodictyon sp. TaxID=1846217 RepID=UPI0034588E33
MSISSRSGTGDENNLWEGLNDGRTLGVPLAWFPRLPAAARTQRDEYALKSPGHPRRTWRFGVRTALSRFSLPGWLMLLPCPLGGKLAP